MNGSKTQEAINELYSLTECRCGEEWTSRGLHSSECNYEYRANVDTVLEAFNEISEVFEKWHSINLTQSELLRKLLVVSNTSHTLEFDYGYIYKGISVK